VPTASLLRLRRFGNASARDAAYLADPGLIDRGFTAQQNALDGALGPFSAPLASELQQLGWDASDLILGVPAVREAWIREHGPLPEVAGVTDLDARLAIGEIRRRRPDIVLEGNLNVLDRRVVAALRREPDGPRLLVGHLGTAKRYHRALDLDLVLVPCDRTAQVLRPLVRGSVEVLPHSFDPGVLVGMPERSVEHELVFAGALGPRYVLRHDVLMALLEHTSIEAWYSLRKGVVRQDGQLLHPAEGSTTLAGRAVGALPTSMLARLARWSDQLGGNLNRRIATQAGARLLDGRRLEDPEARFRERCHPAVAGRDYLELIRRSGVVVHREGDELDGCGAALRLFEVTGLGAALLVDASAMVSRLFSDDEVVTFTNAADAVEKARWLLEHQTEREMIARAGQARTLRDHTTKVRAATLSTMLNERLSRRRGVGAPSD